MATCATTPVLSRNVSFTYGAVYFFLVIIVSIYSYHYLSTHNIKFISASGAQKFKMWALDVWRRKRCYIPILVHVFDQVTDISVAIQFYQLSQTKYNNDWEACNGLNIFYLFVLTVLSIITYRLLSSILIYHRTNSLQRGLLQIFDLELFRTLYVNYICNKTEPSHPQIWITTFECVFESSPQAVIQIIYLLKTGTLSSNPLIILSLIFSLWSIIAKLLTDDKYKVLLRASSLHFKFSPRMFSDTLIGIIVVILWVITFIFYVIPIQLLCGVPAILFENCFQDRCCPKLVEKISQCQDSISRIVIKPLTFFSEIVGNVNRFKWISCWYLTRVFWRVCDVSVQIILMGLIWTMIGGTYLFIKFFIEFAAILLVCIYTKQWQFMFSVIATTVDTTTDKLKTLCMMMIAYRTVTNLLMGFVLLIVSNTGTCWRCVDPSERDALMAEPIIIVLIIYVFFGTVLGSAMLLFLCSCGIFKSKTTTSRDLDAMTTAKNVDGILEMQLYAGKYFTVDEKNKKTLLMFAMESHHAPIVSFLLNRYDVYDETDMEDWNLLDYYIIYIDEDPQHMTDNLMKIYMKHPNIKSTQLGFTIFLCGCYSGNLELITELIQIDANVVTEETANGRNGATLAQLTMNDNIVDYLQQHHNINANINDNILNYYIETGNSMTTAILMKIASRFPGIKGVYQPYTVFLYACYVGNLQAVQKLIKIDPNVINETYYGLNCYYIARQQKHNNILQYLSDSHNVSSNHKLDLLICGCSNEDLLPFMGLFQCKYTKEKKMQLKKEIHQKIVMQMLSSIDYIQNDENKEPELQLSDLGKSAAKLFNEQAADTEVQLTQEIANLLQTLFKENAIIKAMCGKLNFSDYFYNEIDRVLSQEYEPNDKDILIFQNILHSWGQIKESFVHIVGIDKVEKSIAKWQHELIHFDHVVYALSLDKYDELVDIDNQLWYLDSALSDFKLLYEKFSQSGSQSGVGFTLFLVETDAFIEKVKKVPFSVYQSDTPQETANDAQNVVDWIHTKFSEIANKKLSRLNIHRTLEIDNKLLEKIWHGTVTTVIGNTLANNALI